VPEEGSARGSRAGAWAAGPCTGRRAVGAPAGGVSTHRVVRAQDEGPGVIAGLSGERSGCGLSLRELSSE
jgi:hypothetical protein